MTSTELSKAARIERRKLRATYINTVALTFFIAGVATPYYAMLAIPPADYIRMLEAIGTPAGPRLATIAAWIGSWAISLLLHYVARGVLEDLED
ncbi:hypothetical protein [Bradyrhizobium sp. CCBAU 45394]|uniref:hypothetical protein n=1 Tax=Bradyrhizobium sp. CCBAU 45394 TaxID=1325087 RepID=UPI002303AC9E|nr:hypothetical protein [Bradyrhizobium sp. CCBAU 45394]